MRVEKIDEHEASFRDKRRDTDGKTHTLIRKAIEIPGEGTEMRYVDDKPANGDESYFYLVKHPKDQIALHYTMGYLRGDIATLTKPNYHVSVPFVISRDGSIYNLFASYYWSYHLGKGAVGGNQTRSRAAIGIELSNIGPLVRNGNLLETSYSKPGKRDAYCNVDQTEHYAVANFRDFDYYATFTDTQYQSLIVLLRYLTARYGIPRKFLPAAKRFATTNETAHFRGIVSHVNYRRTGKTDIGPAFDWQRVIGGVTA